MLHNKFALFKIQNSILLANFKDSMISLIPTCRSGFGSSANAVFIKSSRYLTFRNRNPLSRHQAFKANLIQFFSDNKTRLVGNLPGSRNMSTFIYPPAKRVDVVENLHGIAVKTTYKTPFIVEFKPQICFGCSDNKFNYIILHPRLKTLTAGLKTQIHQKLKNLFVFKMN